MAVVQYYLVHEFSGQVLPNGDWADEHDDECQTGHSHLRRALMDLARTVAWKGGLDSWNFDGDAVWHQDSEHYLEMYILVRRETYRYTKAGRFCGKDIQERTLQVTPKRLALYLTRAEADRDTRTEEALALC